MRSGAPEPRDEQRRESPVPSLFLQFPRHGSLSSPNKRAFLVLDNEAPVSSPPAPSLLFPYHFRTFSIAAMTRLMSSLALLRVSARTDLPDIAAVGDNIF